MTRRSLVHGAYVMSVLALIAIFLKILLYLRSVHQQALDLRKLSKHLLINAEEIAKSPSFVHDFANKNNGTYALVLTADGETAIMDTEKQTLERTDVCDRQRELFELTKEFRTSLPTPVFLKESHHRAIVSRQSNSEFVVFVYMLM